MGKFTGMIIVSDMDGTLLDKDKKIPQINLDKIDYFMENGGIFTIATGRSSHSIKKYMDILKVNAPVICYNGGSIYDFENEKTVWSVEIDNKIAMEVVDEVVANFSDVGVELFTPNNIYIPQENELTKWHMELEGLTYEVCDYKTAPRPWYKFIFANEYSKLKLVEDFIREKGYVQKYPDIRFVYSETFFYEFLPKTCTKGNALKHLCEIMGVDMKNSFAIGDNHNDEEMLLESGMGFSVANGEPEMREIASKVLCHCNDGAVAELVDYIEGMVK